MRQTENVEPGSEREYEIMDKVSTFFDIAVSGNTDALERMDKSQRYTCGDQWDPTIKNANTARRKFSLTIPLIRPQVKQIVGYYLQNPKDPSIRAVRGGASKVAELLTALAMHAAKDESIQFEIAQTVDECATVGRSYVGVFIEHERDPRYGDLEIKKLDYQDVLPDPTCREYDINNRRTGAKFIIWRPWVDKDWLAKQYPDKAQQVGSSFGSASRSTGFASYVKNLIGAVVGQRMTSIGPASDSNPEDTEFSKLRDRLNHTWWIEYKPIYYFYVLDQDRSDPLVLVNEEEKAEAERAVSQFPDRFLLEETIAPVMNHTISVGNVFLENRYDELNLMRTGQTLYPVVPFNCYFNNGYVSGIAEDLIGAQDFVNAMRSTTMNILKKMPNHGYIINSDVGKTYKATLQKEGGMDGFIGERDKAGGEITPIEPRPLPSAVVQLTELGKAEMREITGVRTEQPESSGKEGWQTVQLKQQASITGSSPILNNIDFSLHMLFGLLATVIRSTPVYSDSEIAKIIEEKDLIDPKLLAEARQVVSMTTGIPVPPPVQFNTALLAQMRPEDAEAMQMELRQADFAREAVLAKLDAAAKPMAIAALIDAMRNPRNGRYDSAVTTSPTSTTFRSMQMGQLIELQELALKLAQPVNLLPEIIGASDYPDKDKILEKMGANV